MSFKVRYSRTARKAITEKLPEAVAAAALEFIGSALADNPQRVGKPLNVPFAGQYAARRGAYRIVYRIDGDTVYIINVAHRATAYRA